MNWRVHLSAAQIEQARAVDLVELAESYGTKLIKDGPSGVELVGPCPVCGGHDRFAIRPIDRVFHCRGCARGGRGAIDLLIFLSGVSFAEAVRELTGNLSGELRSISPEAKARELARQQAAADHEAEQHDMARKLWRIRHPAAGSLVETYLHARGFHGIIPPTIGFLPASLKYPTPKMIAAFGLPGTLVRAVYLTELCDDGSDRLRHDQAKRAVASHKTLPVIVSPIGADGILHVCEGIEAALLWAHAGGAWAACGANFMPALAQNIPENVKRLVIEQDDDDAGKLNTRRLIEAIRELERTGVRPVPMQQIDIVGERP